MLTAPRLLDSAIVLFDGGTTKAVRDSEHASSLESLARLDPTRTDRYKLL